jgi:hypothetical protein
MTSPIAVGLIGIQYRAAEWNVLVNQEVAGALFGMLTDPETVFG